MKFVLVAVVVLAVAAGTAQGWTLPFFGDKATSTVAPAADAPLATSQAPSVSPAPCVETQTLSPTLEILADRLPPQLSALVTPDNVDALKNVGVLAGLATSAATGNPIAIVKLVQFLMSKDNPIGPLVDMTKEIVPLLKPGAEQMGQSIKNATSAASNTIKEEVVDIREDFKDFLNMMQESLKRPTPTAVPTTVPTAA